MKQQLLFPTFTNKLTRQQINLINLINNVISRMLGEKNVISRINLINNVISRINLINNVINTFKQNVRRKKETECY